MLNGPVRAPSQDGGILAVPPLEQAAALLRSNRGLLDQQEYRFLDTPLSSLRQQARSEVLTAARRYLARLEEPPAPTAPEEGPLLLAGHQPELFHPGVWIKNFALAGLARRLGGTALNLIVDSDNMKSATIQVPVPAQNELGPRAVSFAFDQYAWPMAYEERTVLNFDQFRAFGQEVTRAMQAWGIDPLMPTFWEEVIRQANRSPEPVIGECFAAARRSLERSWGCHNLEVPLSLVCQTPAFATFALHLLTQIEPFFTLYNRSVQDYRLRQGLRSRNHPVPDLEQIEDWFEVPLWGWRHGQRQRGRLFVRAGTDQTELRVRLDKEDHPWPTLPPLHRIEAARLAWLDLEKQGYKIRSRALITTLFARVVLGDLFIHGIGGGKYDELTDELIRQFVGFEPPRFLIVSGTRRLPLPTYPVQEADLHRLARARRDLHWNPQRHLPPRAQANPVVQKLVQQKQEWIARQPEDRLGRRQRFRVLQHLTDELRQQVADEENALARDYESMSRQLEANALLRSREYAFCLFPERHLRPFLTAVL